MCEDTGFENLLKGMQTDYSAEAQPPVDEKRGLPGDSEEAERGFR